AGRCPGRPRAARRGVHRPAAVRVGRRCGRLPRTGGVGGLPGAAVVAARPGDPRRHHRVVPGPRRPTGGGVVKVDATLAPADLLPAVTRLWEASAAKLDSIERTWSPEQGSPVFTVDGRYAARGWTEWTQGFQYGSALLQFDATGEERFLRTGREATLTVMAPHVSHIGVHDHGFNNVSTYGNLWRMMVEGRIPDDPGERTTYELAL